MKYTFTAAHIDVYTSMRDLIRENTTAAENEKLIAKFNSRDDYDLFLSVDDYESYYYFVLDYSGVVIAYEGDIIAEFKSLDELVADAVREIAAGTF